MKNVHDDIQEIANSKGGLFDVEAPHLEKNIGKVAFVKEWNPSMGTQAKQAFLITGIQKMWGYNKDKEYTFGNIGYRGVAFGDKSEFGRPLPADNIEFVEADDPRILQKINEYIDNYDGGIYVVDPNAKERMKEEARAAAIKRYEEFLASQS